MGIKASRREIRPTEREFQLRETEIAYEGLFEGKRSVLVLGKTFFWNRPFYFAISLPGPT
jgi:hypothetical protein